MTSVPLEPRLSHDSIVVGPHVAIVFQRTLRIPDDGNDYPLPAGFGNFPLRRVRDYARSVPLAWRDADGFMLPMHRHEAMWMSFGGSAHWHPSALQIRIGDVNVISGRTGADKLRRRPYNYVVIPEQPWIDGIKVGPGIIRQFIASPLGEGHTVEQQITGGESVGGMQFTLVPAVAGRFPDEAPHQEWRRDPEIWYISESAVAYADAAMGLGAGGRMRQKLYPDSYQLGTWDQNAAVEFRVHLVDARDWKRITGEEPPPSPIDAGTYARAGIPWFALWDEHLSDVTSTEKLRAIKPVPV